jgi:hypothetical protein
MRKLKCENKFSQKFSNDEISHFRKIKKAFSFQPYLGVTLVFKCDIRQVEHDEARGRGVMIKQLLHRMLREVVHGKDDFYTRLFLSEF